MADCQGELLHLQEVVGERQRLGQQGLAVHIKASRGIQQELQAQVGHNQAHIVKAPLVTGGTAAWKGTSPEVAAGVQGKMNGSLTDMGMTETENQSRHEKDLGD